MIKIFIGYDPVEAVAYNVFSHSILLNATKPVSITPVALNHLDDYTFWRERDDKQSNEFSFSRWLVPHLCGYKGYAIFTDCDMLCLGDLAELWALRDPSKAVMCVKHHHVPVETEKYLGNKQLKYEKKNWSSVMIFNCSLCEALTPDYVNSATGLELHQFKWLESDDLIGALPPEWNHLVGYDEPDPETKIAHFTIGGPYFNEYTDCEFSSEWFNYHREANYCGQR